MEVDNPSRKLDFDEYCDTPKKKSRQQAQAQTTNLEVFLRIRPKDKSKQSTAEYTITNENKSIRLCSPNQTDIRNYSFDYIFDQHVDNSKVFDQIGMVAINRFLSGYSNLIFSYGITGSGKTHTIMGADNQMDGLIPKILSGIFNHNLFSNNNNNNNNNDDKYHIFASYMENYTKDVYDLLTCDNNNNNNNTKGLTIRVLPSGVDIPDLTTIQITNTMQALQLIQSGNLKRSKAHTKLNTNSSRSHALFILDLFDNNNNLKSQLCIVDLAGSESVKRTGFNPNDIRFNESCEINTSLSVLSRCIESIQNNQISIPWREVVLTKILYQYLTGHGYVSMIVNAHITNDDYNETMRALEFGSNSQNIQMNPIVNSVRASTRHKQRIFVNGNHNNGQANASHINYINSLNNTEQLKKIAVESYKTVIRSRAVINNLKNSKIKQVEMVERFHENKNKIESIEEESVSEAVDELQVLEDRYNTLSQQMVDKEIALNEKRAEVNHLYNEMKTNKEMKETMKKEINEKNQLINNMNNEMNKCSENMQRIRQEQMNMNNEMNKCKIINSKLQATVTRYKSVMDDSEQKMEQITHTNRDLKERLQKQHIEITESNTKIHKLSNERDKLQNEYSEKSNQFDKSIHTYEKVSADLQNEILSLNKQNLDREQKMKQLIHDINGKNKEIECLSTCNMNVNQQIKQRNEEILQKTKAINVFNEEIAALNKYKCDFMEKEKEVNRLQTEINQKNEKILKLNHWKSEMEKDMTGKNELLSKLSKYKSEKEKEMKQKTGQLKQKNETIKQKIEIIKQKNEEIKQKTEDIKQNKEDIYKRTEENKIKTKQISNLKKKLNMEKVSNDKMLNEINSQKNDEIESLNKYKLEINDKNKQISHLKNLLKNEKSNSNLGINEQKEKIINLEQVLNNIQSKHNESILLKHNEMEQQKQEIIRLNNFLNAQQVTNNKIINELNTEMKNINIKLNLISNEKNELINKLNDSSDWYAKYQQLYQTYSQQSNQNENIKIKYNKQCNKLLSCQSMINELRNELNRTKNNFIQQIKTIENESMTITKLIEDQFNDKILQLESQKFEISETKNKIIMQWKSKCSEYDMNNLEITNEYESLRNKYNVLETEYEKNKEFHVISLNEADTEYNKAQKEIERVYLLNIDLENKMKALQNENKQLINGQTEKTELQKQLKFLQQQLTALQLRSIPQSNQSNKISNKSSNKTSRKRPRQEMENGNIAINQITNPNKKRKITAENNENNMNENDDDHTAIVNDDENNNNNNSVLNVINDDNDVIIKNNDENNDNNIENNNININVNNNQSSSMSLEPRHLLSDLLPVTPLQEIPESKVLKQSNQSNIKIKLVSPALSHLSEGDEPLQKQPRFIIKSIKRKTKHKLKRTPATKQSKTRHSNFNNKIAETPITKAGLRKLRCIDLKQKLRKHDLKSYGKKEELVSTLFNHKNNNNNQQNNNNNNKNNNNNNEMDSENEEFDEDEMDMEYEWIGKCIRQENGKKYYAGIRMDGKYEYLIGDECTIRAESDEEWMSQIVELYSDHKGFAFMRNMWFWKYNEIMKALKKGNKETLSNKKQSKYEVFMSDGHAADVNHISLILTDRQFKVFKSKLEMEAFKKNNKGKNNIQAYFSQYYFNTKTKSLIPRSQNENNSNSNGKVDKENQNVKNNKKQRTRNRKKKRS